MDSLTHSGSQSGKLRVAQATHAARRASIAMTRGVRIEAVPTYLAAQSNPAHNEYIFGYHITITNTSSEIIQIVARHWTIIDANGRTKQVDGQGVVGQQPLLEPGEVFEYSSYCPLSTPWGTMEGTYTVQTRTDEFQAGINRFYFVS